MYAYLIVVNILIYWKILDLLARFQAIGLFIIKAFAKTVDIFTVLWMFVE